MAPRVTAVAGAREKECDRARGNVRAALGSGWVVRSFRPSSSFRFFAAWRRLICRCTGHGLALSVRPHLRRLDGRAGEREIRRTRCLAASRSTALSWRELRAWVRPRAVRAHRGACPQASRSFRASRSRGQPPRLRAHPAPRGERSLPTLPRPLALSSPRSAGAGASPTQPPRRPALRVAAQPPRRSLASCSHHRTSLRRRRTPTNRADRRRRQGLRRPSRLDPAADRRVRFRCSDADGATCSASGARSFPRPALAARCSTIGRR
jgi:hypothetical protein